MGRVFLKSFYSMGVMKILKKYNVAVIDDDMKSINLIKEEFMKLDKELGLHFITIGYLNPLEYLVEEKEYDFIFIDIDMPKMNGFDLAKKIYAINKNEKIIFMSESFDHILEGYLYRPYGFVLKNHLLALKLKKNVQKVLDILDKEDIYMTLIAQNGYQKISYKSIFYCRLNGRTISIFTSSGIYSKCVSMHTLSNELNQLGDFFRINKSEIVNLNYVKEIKNQQVILKNGTVLMASVRKWLLLRERFCNYRSKVIY